MPTYAVLGGHWGDEGKGKVVDVMAGKAQLVARFSGGNNAGHTMVVPEGKFTFHILPSGMCREGVINLIGDGAVVDPDVLLEELKVARDAGLPGHVRVSDKAHIVMPYHKELDRLEEISRGRNAIGTTGRGIGPAYSDKAARRGIRVGELNDIEALMPRVRHIVEYQNAVIIKIYGGTPFLMEQIEEKLLSWRDALGGLICLSREVLDHALDRDWTMVLEGAQGALLDVDHGNYPFVTSSNSTIGGAISGLGMPPKFFSGIIGVYKAYCTRVGAGPFPTEMSEYAADVLREDAGEFGATTGRPRRIGWFDAVAGAYSSKVNGFDSAVLTRLDTLDNRDEVKICIAYELDGYRTDLFPNDISALARYKPIYETLPGWEGTTYGLVKWDALPKGAKAYVRRVEEILDLPITGISTGPAREQLIDLTSSPVLV